MALSDKRKSSSSTAGKSYTTNTISGSRRAREQQQYADAMKSSRTMETDKIAKQKEADKFIKDKGLDISSKYGPNSSLAKTGETLLNSAAGRTNKISVDDVMLAYQSNDSAAKKRLESSGWNDLPQSEQTKFRNLALDRKTELIKSNRSDFAKGLGKIGEKVKPVSEFLGSVYTPGAGLGVIQGLTQGAEYGVAKALPGLARTALSQAPEGASLFQKSLPSLARIGQTALAEGIVGVPTQFANTLTRTGDLKQSAKEGLLYGGLGGAVLGGAGRAIGEGVQGLRGIANNAASQGVESQLRAVNALDSAQPVQSLPQSVSRNLSGLGVSKIQPPNEPWFNKLFGDQAVGITPGSRKAKELIDTHVVSRPTEQGSLLERAGELIDSTKQDYIDRFAPFRKIDQETYDAAMDSTRANNLANVTIKDKFVDLEGNVIGNSLKDVYSAVPRGQKNIADRYLIARDAVNRMDRNQQVYGDEQWFPKTSDDAAQLVAKLEAQYPWLTQFGEQWNQFNRNRQDLWVQSGIASQNLIDTLRQTNPNYTPMFRQQARRGLSKQLAMNTSKSGFSGQKAPIKKAVGSARKIIEPAQGMIETTASSYNAMMRNRAMQSLYESVSANPERYKGVIEVVDQTPVDKEDTIKTIEQAIADNGPDGIADMLNDEINNIISKSKTSGRGDSIVTVMVNGDPVKMRVQDPSLLKAIEGIYPQQLDGVMRVADTISRAIKQSATGVLAPLQGARLAFRDLPVAAAQSKDKLRFLGDIVHAAVSQIGDWLPNYVPGSERLGKLARDYYRAGGGYEAYLKGDSRIRSAARDITKDPILSGRNLVKQARKYNPLVPFKALGDAMENIPRIAAYAAEMRRNGWKATPENVRRAVDAGREATVNWSRRGSKMQGIEAFAPYTNAALQGTYRVIKRFKEQPISATALILATAGAKIAAYEKFKDDPDYQQRSKYDKGIPVSKTKDGKFVSAPVEPTEAYIADQVLNFYKWAKDNEAYPDAGETVQEGLEAFTPSLISGPASALTTQSPVKEYVAKTLGGTVADPLIAMGTGKNFAGGDIIPREYQEDPTSIQYNETTSAPGKWAAENLGIDAFTFDYLANKFGGDIAKIGLPLTSEVGKADIKGNALDQVNARIKLLEDPVMRNNISDDYYKHLKAVSDAKAISDKNKTPLPSWYESAYDDVTSLKKNSVNRMVSDLNAKKKEILRNTTLSASQRSDQLRDVQREINMIRIQGIKRLQELGVKL